MNAKAGRETIAERIRAGYAGLTRTERKFADSLMAKYPVAGLSSITDVAAAAGVSMPTVLRTVKKLGFSGFPAFQAGLRKEVEDTLSNPITKHEQWSREAPAEHILNRFASAAMENLSRSLMQIDYREFDRLSALLADDERAVAIVGGRITHALADYMATHLQVIRDGITRLPASPSQWPHHLLNMKKGDVLIVFDIRRYETNLADFTRLAERRGIVIVLFTDQWLSPLATLADFVISARIEVPSGWDSGIVSLFMIEALISAIQDRRWPQTRTRINELEKLFDATGRFTKKPKG